MQAYKGMKIEILNVSGLRESIKGMRNPMDSWHLSDSETFNAIGTGNFPRITILGTKDKNLAQRLIKAGTEHCKFLRQIIVWIDVTMPRYWWSEADTYHFGSKNSCSTMHKLLNRKNPITIDDFYIESYETKHVIMPIINYINELRDDYRKEPTSIKIRKAKQILPEGFLQTRTWCTNYQELRNIYLQRRNHRLDKEWGLFIDTLKELPHAEELIFFE